MIVEKASISRHAAIWCWHAILEHMVGPFACISHRQTLAVLLIRRGISDPPRSIRDVSLKQAVDIIVLLVLRFCPIRQ